MAHNFNPTTQEAEAGRSLFETSLVYIMHFRTAGAAQRHSLYKIKKKKRK